MRLIATLVFEPLWLAAALRPAVVITGGSIQQDPIALADRKLAASRVMHGRGADWLTEFFAAQRRQNVVAIFGGTVGQLRAKNRGDCCHKIDVTDRFVACFAGGDLPGPASDERHTVAAFPDVALATSQLAHAGMAAFL